MINLLPTEENKSELRAYKIRVVILILVTLFVVILISLLFLFPSYVITDVKKTVTTQKLSTIEGDLKDKEKEPLSDIIKDINTKLKIFTDPKEQFVFSRDILKEILDKKPSEVHITSIGFKEEKNAGDGGIKKTILISGFADTRLALLSFERALKEDTRFADVVVPISNFIKGSNIQFTLKFILK
jgi:hypothetical protein